jgi:hypothetical protein
MELCPNQGRLRVQVVSPVLLPLSGPDLHVSDPRKIPCRTKSCQKFRKFVTTSQYKDHITPQLSFTLGHHSRLIATRAALLTAPLNVIVIVRSPEIV